MVSNNFFKTLTAQFVQIRPENRSSLVMPGLAVIVTIIILLLFKLAQPEPPLKKQEEKTWLVETVQLTADYKVPQLKLYGQVDSPFKATITAGINADVKTLDVKEGEYVESGQVMVTLDDSDVRLALEDSIAAMTELEALIQSENTRYKNDLEALKLEKSLVSLAEKKLKREMKTSKSNLTSQSSLDSQRQALDQQKLSYSARKLGIADHPSRLAQLQAKLHRSQAQVELARKNVQRARLTAPYNAIILSTSVAPGERVRTGEALVELYAIDRLEIRAQIPDSQAVTVKQSLEHQPPLTATVYTPSGEVRVTLDRLSGKVGTGGIDAFFSVSADISTQFALGETYSLVLNLPEVNNVYSVPVSSIYGTNRIYRMRNDRLEAIDINIKGYRFRGSRQYALVYNEMLKPGDEIITTQLPYAVTGLKVVRKKMTDDSSSPTPH